jgi:hypothetical protein
LIKRFQIPIGKTVWKIKFSNYSPIEFTSINVLGIDGKRPVWADPTEISGR